MSVPMVPGTILNIAKAGLETVAESVVDGIEEDLGKGIKFIEECLGLVKPHLYNFALPQYENAKDLITRQKHLKDYGKRQYNYAVYKTGVLDGDKSWLPGSPRIVQNVPKREEFSIKRLAVLGEQLLSDGALLVKDFGKELFSGDNPISLKDFETIYNEKHPAPKIMQFWKLDSCFAQQRVAGFNNFSLQVCKKVPKCLIKNMETEKKTIEKLFPGTTFEDELKNGNVMMVDHTEMLKDIYTFERTAREDGRYLANPVALFWCKNKKEMVPILIQLTDDAKVFFTPLDEDYDWILAKMHFQCADEEVGQFARHLCQEHLFAEVFTIATSRNLSGNHPLNPIIRLHMSQTIAINWLARKELLTKSGLIARTMSTSVLGGLQIIGKHYPNFNLGTIDFKENLKQRGLEIDEKTNIGSLPFPFRDDGILIYDAINAHVSDVLELWYESDEDVAEDWELQAMLKELNSRIGGDLQFRGIPEKLETRKDLTAFLTTVFFNSSANHNSISSSQYEFQGFIPNQPAGMYSKPPNEKGATLDDILKALPDKTHSNFQLAISLFLSQDDQTKLGKYKDSPVYHSTQDFFKLKPVVARFDKFQAELEKITKTIKIRNETRLYPYEYMMDDKLAGSIFM